MDNKKQRKLKKYVFRYTICPKFYSFMVKFLTNMPALAAQIFRSMGWVLQVKNVTIEFGFGNNSGSINT